MDSADAFHWKIQISWPVTEVYKPNFFVIPGKLQFTTTISNLKKTAVDIFSIMKQTGHVNGKWFLKYTYICMYRNLCVLWNSDSLIDLNACKCQEFNEMMKCRS